MEILKTSKFIRSIFDDEINDGYMEEGDIDYGNESRILFNTFSSNKSLKIDYGTIDDFLTKFDILYKSDFFMSFKEPLVQEYFCQQLNFLLLIDFILSFFRTNNKVFDVKKINTAFIFDFFVKLCDFYSFMNFLDVDYKFVDYLKYMITLYTLQLRREVIEKNFHYNIEILDNFFANEIMPKVFQEITYKNLNDLSNKIVNFNKMFEEELKDYNSTTNYINEEFLFVDNIFLLNYGWTQVPTIRVKTTEVEVMNPNPPPFNFNNNEDTDEDDNDTADDDTADDDTDDDDTADISDYYSDEDDNYYGSSSRNTWTPTIKKQIPNIEENDTNYKVHRNIFIFKHYQKLKNEYDSLIREVRIACSSIKIKAYDDFMPHDNTNDIIKVKSIIGIKLDLNSVDKSIINNVYDIACEYGHLEIVKSYVEFKNGDLDYISIRKAAASPNREILKFLKDSCKQYKKLDKIFHQFKDATFYEQKIKINAS